MTRGTDRRGTVLVIALGVGLVVRVVRLATDTLLHPDGPAYLGLAAELLDGRVRHVLGNYYSPLYPAAVALVAATGVPLELAGRMTALGASLAALPLLYFAVHRMLGVRAATAAVLVAALQPALVKASVQVLPETLAGVVLLGWLLALPEAPVVAGVLAGAAYLVRPEGIMLLPLGLWRLRRQPFLRVRLVHATAAVLVMLPVLLALRAETGHWQLSPREARIAAGTGIPGATSLAGAAVRAPARLAGRIALGIGEQTLHDAKALSPLLLLPFVAGLASASVRRAAGWPLAVVAVITVVPLALNPSPRYAVPLVPLFLPAVGAGLLALGERLGRWVRPAAAVLAVALVVQALWVSHRADAACSREVSALVLSRYGAGQPLVAVDGRFAYGARGRALVPASNDPDAALGLARRHGARLWLTRPRWLPKSWVAPPDVQPVARPCDGTFVLYEIG